VATLRAGALIDLGRSEDAETVLRAVDVDVAAVPAGMATAHAVASVRAALATDPEVACALAEFALAAAGADAPPALLAAQAAALRAAGREGWDAAARSAMATAAATGDRAAGRQAGAALVAGLRDSLRVAEAGRLASELAEAAAADRAYSAELQFRAEALWAALHVDGALDEVVRSAAALVERTAPAPARALLIATLALAHADAGGLPTARALLGRAGAASGDRTVRWVAAETAWLDGNAPAARAAADALPGRDLPARLALLTGRWARRDADADAAAADAAEPLPRSGALGRIGVEPVAMTVAAWDAGGTALVDAAVMWAGVMTREQVRCLLGAGLAGPLEPLLAAEQLAEAAGLAALLGRVRRALRVHGVTRRPTARAGELSPREHEVLALVGEGLSTRRIAELLGVTRHTAETHVRSGMAKLGARTRTEAAVRAAALAPAGA
jgi:DNA-binding CsgD family transcriptional regulator